MKRTLALMATAITISMIFSGCQRETKDLVNNQPELAAKGKPAVSGVCNSNAYVVSLETKTESSGNWTWTWSVQNPNPGNGTNGTSQDLSHWGMQFGQCFSWADVVGASYSMDGNTWTSFTPTYKVDPSQSCVTTAVLKYDVGTNGTAKTYYRLVLSKNYSIDPNAFAYYKSGARMPCCTFTFNGVGCPIVDEGCSLSQGYWFANGNHIWPDVNGAAAGNVTIGGFNYTEAEGRDIWNTSNAGGLRDSKKAFLQVAAIKLSGSSVSPTAAVWADVAICEAWLATLGKLSPANLPTGNASVSTAAGNIGDWINTNHCEEILPTRTAK